MSTENNMADDRTSSDEMFTAAKDKNDFIDFGQNEEDKVRRRYSDKIEKKLSSINDDIDSEECVRKRNYGNFRFLQHFIEVLLMSLKRFEFKLYATLLISQLLPVVYRTVRIYYLGDLPNSSGVDIASQLVWVNLILEVVQEALILPLYYLIGQAISIGHTETKNRIKIGIMLTFGIHVAFTIIVYLLAYPLAKSMGQKSDMLDCTVNYVRLELVSILFDGVNQFAMVIMTLFNWQKHIYIVLIIKMTVSVTMDTFFLSESNFSLRLGVNGIAYSNISSSFLIFLYCILLILCKLGFKLQEICNASFYSFSWLKSWLKVGLLSGLDSLIRNIFYILCVIRMMNVIAKQSIYWRGNEFIWNWLLLPFHPIGKVLKQDTGNDTTGIDHKVKMAAYFGFVFLISMFWACSIPGWKPFFQYVMNVGLEDVDEIYNLVLILFPFYLTFMINLLLDSVFYGKGKTQYMAIQSAITNFSINLPVFILFLTDIFKPTILSISLVFGSGILMDNVITMYLYWRFLPSRSYRI